VSAFGGQKPQFCQFLTFEGLLYRRAFTDESQIWCARADPRSTVTRQISSECVRCVGFLWVKTQFWANFEIWGLLYRPLSPMRAKFSAPEQTHSVRLRAKFRLDRFILSLSDGENPQFLPFLEFGIY